ncbi:energy-coupling factor transporter transmembrane protein EcfT [Weissella diestrammenae]|uniref:Energy-coupling factor transporter transmembrane protein EcfT n=1 Tax=Weissella diestrammenae TaxID=1162633 RepID=A0A7G9T674_9LACO|nr:energy-coupling factor transporter transmembrane component T [Weissella diestrammenae]MCM0583358.1 energy-coupling factor transporter transmembrane protein EcfT [Weissella diestrammenae]QNN75599.1 energy-coupling factor transporter transmembrane protein EcfT [Weissella diestrammenae]
MTKWWHVNPTLLTLFVLWLSLEISFIKSISLNLILIGLALIYLLLTKVKYKTLLLMLFVSLPFAIGTWLSFWLFSTTQPIYLAAVYTTRLYAYLLLGAAITLTTNIQPLLLSLHQHVKLPNTFTFGLLAAFNLLPRVKQQLKTIQYAAELRGLSYHLWHPHLYFKAIVSALNWSTDLAEAMTSHGFSEGFNRSEPDPDVLPLWQVIMLTVIIILINIYYFSMLPK